MFAKNDRLYHNQNMHDKILFEKDDNLQQINSIYHKLLAWYMQEPKNSSVKTKFTDIKAPMIIEIR